METPAQLVQKAWLSTAKGGWACMCKGFLFLLFVFPVFGVYWLWGNLHSSWFLGFPVGKGVFKTTQLPSTFQVLCDLSRKEL